MLAKFLLNTFYQLNKFNFNSFLPEKMSKIQNWVVIVKKITVVIISLGAETETQLPLPQSNSKLHS
ncbi:hypothetical protein AFK68_09945 [Hydrocoleum sp. CS-953]|nr:hypothetical protein AFK68_09945 [Hydrocoleum sp. CS-953]